MGRSTTLGRGVSLKALHLSTLHGTSRFQVPSGLQGIEMGVRGVGSERVSENSSMSISTLMSDPEDTVLRLLLRLRSICTSLGMWEGIGRAGWSRTGTSCLASTNASRSRSRTRSRVRAVNRVVKSTKGVYASYHRRQPAVE